MGNDSIYIDRLKNGDEACLEDIYGLYRNDFIEWSCRKFQLDAEEARDLFQVSLITFYENVQNEKLTVLNCSLRTYLFAIGKYKVLRDKKKSVMFANLDDLPDINILETDHEEVQLQEEQQSRVNAALVKLGGDCQKILELFYFKEFSMAQIANVFNYKNDNVAKVKKANCMRKLTAIFKAIPSLAE